MTEQDKKYVIEALEYALHKCIDANGNAETHYNTLANAIEVVKNCSIPDVSGRSEQLKCQHQYINSGTLQGEAMKKCIRCGDYVRAL